MTVQTLEELDGPWSGPPWDTDLVAKVTQLRKKPLDELTIEDLRILIGQQIALAHLVPRALEILEREPLAEGDLYPGDLLSSLLSTELWIAEHPGLWERLLQVVSKAFADPR